MSSYVFYVQIGKFNPGTTRYCGDNALVLAEYIKLVYQLETVIMEALIQSWKMINFEFCNGKAHRH